MGLSRKRQREFDRLKKQTEDLVRDQREVLDHASRVVREARHQAANFAREEGLPAVKSGVKATQVAVGHGRDKFVDDVIPALSGALGSALAVIEAAKSPAVRDTFARVSGSAKAVGVKAGIIEAPKSSSPVKFIVLGVALVAAAGVAYAAWQTLRADDSLWVEDEPETPEEA